MATMPLMPGLGRELDRLFGTFGMPGVFTGNAAAFPALNVWEDGDNLLLEAEVPGLSMDDLEILIQGDELTLRGARRPLDAPNATYLRRERAAGEFVRYFSLPYEVDADRVEATLRNGVLTIRLPKSERAKARRIQVRSGQNNA